MDGKKKKVLLITSALTLLAGAGVYLWYTMFREEKPKDDQLDQKNEVKTPDPVTTTRPNPVYSGGSSVTRPSLLATKDALTAFQKWVINTKKDQTILGGGGSTGFGDDGIWGSKSKAAWSKYGAEYTTSLSKPTAPAETEVETSSNPIKFPVGTMVYPSRSWVSVYDEASGDEWDRDGYIWSPNAIGKVKNYTLNDKGVMVYEMTLVTPLRNNSIDGQTVSEWQFNPDAKTGWVKGMYLKTTA
jgi:hypothetical protein